MDPSRLRHFVTLQKPYGVQDAVGQQDTVWQDVATDPASVEPISGREQFLAAQRQASTSHQITIRYNPLLAAMWADETQPKAAAWRVKFGERIFTIDAPPRNVEEGDRWFVLDCTESVRVE